MAKRSNERERGKRMEMEMEEKSDVWIVGSVNKAAPRFGPKPRRRATIFLPALSHTFRICEPSKLRSFEDLLESPSLVEPPRMAESAF